MNSTPTLASCLEFADECCTSSWHRANARALVAAELNRSFQPELDAAEADSLATQTQIALEWRSFRDAMLAVQNSTSQEVVLSPLSGKQRGTWGSAAGAGMEFCVFPSIPLPGAFARSGGRKRARQDDAEYEPVTLSNSSGANDAVYYETLLSQALNAELFLAHADLAAVGDAYLAQLQLMQYELAAKRRFIEDINALRLLEQQEFKQTYQELGALVSKSREKVGTLQRILSIGGDAPGASAAAQNKRSLLLSLE